METQLCSSDGINVEIDIDGDLNNITTQVISKILFGSNYKKDFRYSISSKLFSILYFRASRFVGIPGIGRYAKVAIVFLYYVP